jgi:short-subunit dehydrogenase
MNLTDKLILITGGSSGIGKAAAIELAKKGAEIIIQAQNLDKLKSAAEEIASSGEKVHFYSTDLSKADSVEQSAKQIMSEIGVPDIIINSAGSGEWLSLKEASLSHYTSTIDSPYLATAFTCKAFYDKMLERGSGHLIIVNSAACYFAFPGATGYLAARWAILGFAKSLQADLYDTNIKVSMIALGKVDSPYFTNNPISEERIPKIVGILTKTMTTEYSGKVIADVVKSKKATVIKPVMMALSVWLNRFFPGMFGWLMRVI